MDCVYVSTDAPSPQSQDSALKAALEPTPGSRNKSTRRPARIRQPCHAGHQTHSRYTMLCTSGSRQALKVHPTKVCALASASLYGPFILLISKEAYRHLPFSPYLSQLSI